jgi:tetratricopeptide (TPR) repeat protein
LKNNSYKLVFLALAVVLLSSSALLAQRNSPKKIAETNLVQAALRESEFHFIEAEKYFILEDYTKALLYFQRALEFNPDNAAIHYKIAEVLAKGTKEEDLMRAATSIEKALKLEKKNKYFYALASSIYAGLSNFAKAEAALETLMQEIKGEDEYLYELAALYVFDKKPNEAIRIYDKAEQLLGVNEVSSSQKQRLYLEQGKIEEAVREGEKLMDAFPDEEHYVLAFAEALSSYKQSDKAIILVENYLKSTPTSSNAKVVLAVLYRESGQEKKSQDFTNNLFDDTNVDVSGKVMLAGPYCENVIQNRNKNITDTHLEIFTSAIVKKLIRLYPKDGPVHLLAGDLFMALKLEKEAQQEYIVATNNGINVFEAWQNLLYIDSQLNQFDSLIVHSESALELYPNQAMLHYFNGYGQFRKNHFKEAVNSLEQAKKLSLENPTFKAEINGMLGDAYNGLKEYSLSDKAYEDALTADPNNSLILNNYSYYLAIRKENLDKAEKMSALLIKNNPTNASFLDTYAWVLFMKSNYREAKKVIEKAIAGEATATHFEHYGDILFQLNDVNEAVAQWQKARALRGNNNEQLDKKIANRKLY